MTIRPTTPLLHPYTPGEVRATTGDGKATNMCTTKTINDILTSEDLAHLDDINASPERRLAFAKARVQEMERDGKLTASEAVSARDAVSAYAATLELEAVTLTASERSVLTATDAEYFRRQGIDERTEEGVKRIKAFVQARKQEG